MNDALRMQISAFVDGELPDNENELLLRRLSQDAALRQLVAQYLEVGRLIRQDHEIPGMDELRDRIAAALGEEPTQHPLETKLPSSRFTRPTVGVAIAASVAIMALFGIRQMYAPTDIGDIGGDETLRTVPDSVTAIAQSDDELLRQFYLHHDPRHVTWQLQDGTLVQIEAEDGAADESKDDKQNQEP